MQSISHPALDIEGMPQAGESLARVHAWYEQAVIDRAPVRFSAHNAEYALSPKLDTTRWATVRDRWWDAEYQVDHYLQFIRGQTFRGESFPVFWPNLGPDVYAAFFGIELEFQDVTSYARHLSGEADEVLPNLNFNWDNPYLKKIEEITRLALEKCPGHCLVGYTDLHPGIDCVAAWRDPQDLCLDFLEEPELVTEWVKLATRRFFPVYDHFDRMLKDAGQLSVAWMQIPSTGRMHIPSCDISTLVSPQLFEAFILPALQEEVRAMDHNIFHVDGPGVAKNLDRILEIPEVQCIQWVQGVGTDRPILQWTELIRRILAKGRSVVVDLTPAELEPFIEAFPRPEGIYLCIDAPPADQPALLARIAKW